MLVSIVVLITAALVTVYTDVRTRRIPNWLTGGMVAYGLGYHVSMNGWYGLGASLSGLAAGAGLILLPMLVPFAKRGMGSGDVKFLAAVGSIVGMLGVVLVFIAAGFFGGIQSIIALRRKSIPAGQPVMIPYGVALSLGTLVLTIGSLMVKSF